MALIKCSECGKQISDKAKKCPHCGNVNSAIVCPECGEIINEKNTKICPNCGVQIKKKNDISKKKNIFLIVILIILVILVILVAFFILFSNSSSTASNIVGNYTYIIGEFSMRDDEEASLNIYENGTCFLSVNNRKTNECTYDVSDQEIFLSIEYNDLLGGVEKEQTSCSFNGDNEIYCYDGLIYGWINKFQK